MKTLNKTLSLVLVLVMVLGLFGVAGAAFTDQTDIKYKEAVEVMTGIGAINGYTDGSIKPTGTITREEAAKLIVYSILGKDVAEKLTVGATGFKDVDAGRWSAPYISYLVGEKVISGMGDGTFAPTANVTGYQFAKMMLCAAGYGAKGEFTGSGWELAVAVAANKGDIFAGAKGVDYTKAATREQAMLYAFNGITLTPIVKYNKLYEDYFTVENKGTETYADDNVYQIAEEVYSKLVTTGASADGMDGYRWIYKGQPISSFVENANVLATSNDGTTLAKLTNSSDAKYIGYQPDDAPVVTYKLNGAVSNIGAVNSANVRGVVIKFVDTDNDSKYDVISATSDTVYTVGGDVILKTVGADTKVTVPGLGISSVNVKNVFGYEGLKKDDIVLMHTYNAGANYVITKCGSFTGTLQATNSYANSITVDGKTYKMSGLTLADNLAAVEANAGKAGTTFFTDAGGFVVRAVPASSAITVDNLLFVEASPVADAFGVYKAKVSFGNGTSDVVTISKVNGVAISATLTPANFYTFTKNENGSYNVNTITTQTRTNAIAKNNPVIGGKVATSTTMFLYKDVTNNRVTSYIGISNAPAVTNTSGTTVVQVLYDAKNYATVVVVVATAADIDTSTTTKDYVFAVTPASKTYDSVKGDYYTYQAVVNGEIKTITSTLSSELAPLSLHAVNQYTNGRISGTDGADVRLDALYNVAARKFAFNGSTVSYFTAVADTVPAGSFIATEDCKYFIINADTYTVTAVTAGDVAVLYDTACTLFGVENSTTDARIAQLFVVVR